jgi:hypothetical protein
MVLGAFLGALGFGAVALLLRRWLGWRTSLVLTGFCWWLLVIGLVTLVPLDAIDLRIPAEAAPTRCSSDYGGPAPDGFWIFSGTQRMLNTLLFVPAGALWVLFAARWRIGWLLVPLGLGALAGYSVAIEYTQLEVARIGRACDVTDMVDNSVGALIGIGVGVLLALLVRPWRWGRGGGDPCPPLSASDHF